MSVTELEYHSHVPWCRGRRGRALIIERCDCKAGGSSRRVDSMTDPRALHDSMWDAIARGWLQDCELPAALVERYVPTLAQQLHDCAEQFVNDDIPTDEHERDEAALDAKVDAQIEERRG